MRRFPPKHRADCRPPDSRLPLHANAFRSLHQDLGIFVLVFVLNQLFTHHLSDSLDTFELWRLSDCRYSSKCGVISHDSIRRRYEKFGAEPQIRIKTVSRSATSARQRRVSVSVAISLLRILCYFSFNFVFICAVCICVISSPRLS